MGRRMYCWHVILSDFGPNNIARDLLGFVDKQYLCDIDPKNFISSLKKLTACWIAVSIKE